MPPFSHLRGIAAGQTILRIAFPVAGRDFVIRTSSNTTIAALTLDGADRLSSGDKTSAIRVFGSRSHVHDVEAVNVRNGVGVYFHDPNAAENLFERVHVHHCYYGVIFAHGLDSKHINTFQGGTIEDIGCDSVTFAGYGELIGNRIRNSGASCLVDGKPMPGGGLFCRGNVAGGVVMQNEVTDCCGMIMDVDSCMHFNVSFNQFSTPGHIVGGSEAHCVGATTFTLLNSQRFHVEGNLMKNAAPSNMQRHFPWRDIHHVFYDVDSPEFSDLPAGQNTILNFVIVSRPSTGWLPSIGHRIIGNKFESKCPTDVRPIQLQESACTGLGYFAGRGTGLDARKEWAPHLFYNESVPSSYSSNDPLESDYGSKRCGKNKYATDTAMCLPGADPPCNRDDNSHGHTNWRNDVGCEDYAFALVNSSSKPITHGQIRVQLPLQPRTCPGHGAGPAWSL
jgi:hypothetical protein